MHEESKILMRDQWCMWSRNTLTDGQMMYAELQQFNTRPIMYAEPQNN
jgi:hypothetical protein